MYVPNKLTAAALVVIFPAQPNQQRQHGFPDLHTQKGSYSEVILEVGLRNTNFMCQANDYADPPLTRFACIHSMSG